jgi:hypothetical protein
VVVADAGVVSLIVDRLLGLLIVCWVLGLGLSVLSRSVDHARPVLRGACSTCRSEFKHADCPTMLKCHCSPTVVRLPCRSPPPSIPPSPSFTTTAGDGEPLRCRATTGRQCRQSASAFWQLAAASRVRFVSLIGRDNTDTRHRPIT